MVCIVRPKVGHGFGFGVPWVPDYYVWKHVAFELVSGLVGFEHGDDLVGAGRVDSVDFGVYGDGF